MILSHKIVHKNSVLIFIKTSSEIRLQIANTTGVTSWGGGFIPASATPNVVLYDTLANTFEANDQRKVNGQNPLYIVVRRIEGAQ